MSTKPVVRFLDRTTPPHIITLILLAGLSALSMNVFLPSLPNMTAYFQTDYRLMQLSVALYLAVNAALQIVVGPISDRYGRRPVILWGTVLFIIASVGCVFAPTVEVFLTFRMAQAAIVTGMVLSRAVVRDMVPMEEAASMLGYVTMGMALVPMLSPLVGGVLDTYLGWQSNFWLMALLGVGLFWLVWVDLGETATQRSTSMAQQMRQYPDLLVSQRFWGYCLTAAFTSGSFFAYLGGAPFVGETVFGLSSIWLGFSFGAPAVGYFLGNFLSGRMSVRIGINRMLLWGASLSAAGLGGALILFYAGLSSPILFFGSMTFVGLGNGMVLPNANAGMLSVRPHLAGSAAGLGGAIMIGGGAALSALAGVMLTAETGAFPLMWIMFLSSASGVLSMLFVLYRERRLAGLDL
ncbi:multidrug effflux MFS transporter [Pseudohalocynthiibacter aestuariivivens]|jgi:MFS transporter, DHA1 family, multidrug resistance protein|uniref:Bcr/CflA family efflux transporter n=1 Tax=Pseudohalocynthiibacter aestuariivivens TaxID=1591409 RepID=A0ABV5JDA7_9RHOB|nr:MULTISPECIES: multidrug effflux MFS transporter [Pseudohalocynthiibacter]MBS9715742.1 multidrug effflux MFS transporter [Pseudohalocynthiibacter aestuariivivens]MCK0101354.1 multidrug effflux MFS transporter [Pseudohalocynthiibacter sp. F2068]